MEAVILEFNICFFSTYFKGVRLRHDWDWNFVDPCYTVDAGSAAVPLHTVYSSLPVSAYRLCLPGFNIMETRQ